MNIHLGLTCYKTFSAVIYERLEYARAFVPGKPFQRSLMFVVKARIYPIEDPLRCSTLGVGSWYVLCHKNRLGWRGLPCTNILAYYENS